jgi:hypothetical protein
MDVTSLRGSMKNNQLIRELASKFKHINFEAHTSFYWSPANKTIYYDKASLAQEQSSWSLLHELSHGLLKHTSYGSDYQLLECEVQAWQHAQKLAREFNIKIDTNHIEECLNTYRDWIYARSSCPVCHLNGLQPSKNNYKCLNCKTKWRVSKSRFCRPYRVKQTKTPSGITQNGVVLLKT